MTCSAVIATGLTVRHSRSVVVGPIDWEVPRHGCSGLIGANGAGKTTLLRAITGLLPLSSGHVVVDGEAVEYGYVPPAIAGMIEEPQFLPWLDAVDNLRAVSIGFPDRFARIADVLVTVGLDAGLKRPVGTYSQGMRQRLGIARVLLADRPVMIFDEPTNGLDPVGIRWFRGLVQELVGEGHTVVLSSHMLHEVQLMADTFAMLANGRVLTAGSVDDVQGIGSLEDLYFAAAASDVD